MFCNAKMILVALLLNFKAILHLLQHVVFPYLKPYMYLATVVTVHHRTVYYVNWADSSRSLIIMKCSEVENKSNYVSLCCLPLNLELKLIH